MIAALVRFWRVLPVIAMTLACFTLTGCPTEPVRESADQDKIDALLNLVKSRLALAAQAAEEAWLSGEGSELPGAGEERVDAAVNRALEFTLPPELVRDFFSGQLAAAAYVRSVLHADWQAQRRTRSQAGARSPGSIRPRIEASDTPLLAALAEAYPILRRPGSREFLIQRAEQVLAGVPGGAKTMTLVIVPLMSVAH